MVPSEILLFLVPFLSVFGEIAVGVLGVFFEFIQLFIVPQVD